jgi:putative transposase
MNGVRESNIKNANSFGSHRLRKGRISLPHHIYLITFTTAEQKPIFANFNLASKCCSGICDPSLWNSSTLLCWVLMPDHFHGLVQLGENENLDITIRRLKAHLTRILHASFPLEKKIWQSGFHDHALRNNDNLINASRYIVMNPVRAGLCHRIGDYSFWNAVWF